MNKIITIDTASLQIGQEMQTHIVTRKCSELRLLQGAHHVGIDKYFDLLKQADKRKGWQKNRMMKKVNEVADNNRKIDKLIFDKLIKITK